MTGPGCESWLVKGVGGLAGAIGATLPSGDSRKLAAWSALALAVVGVLYTARRRLSPVHLGDALAGTVLAATRWRAQSAGLATARERGGKEEAPLRDATRSGAGTVGGWDIRPGESLDAAGRRDKVAEASMESFPASDPPAYVL